MVRLLLLLKCMFLMLQDLFRVDFINYTLWPIGNFDDIDKAKDKMKQLSVKVMPLDPAEAHADY
jgi:hypothetical protein